MIRLFAVAAFVIVPVNSGAAEADRMFRVDLPEGDCLMEVPLTDLPDNYYVKSISAGSVDLRRSPLTVSSSAIPRIVVILGVTKHSQGTKVNGRVTGLPTEVLSVRPQVLLLGQGEVLSTRIDADGFFEITHVPAGKYVARVARTLGVQPSPSIPVVVSGKDVSRVLIAMPPVTYIHGRVTVEGAGKLSFLDFSAKGDFGGVDGTVTIREDKTFQLILPKTGCDIALNTSTLPVGYSLRSLKYGSTDLLDTPSIRIPSANAEELQVVVAVTNVAVTVTSSKSIANEAGPNAWVRVKGHVTGLVPDDSRFQVFIHSSRRLMRAIGPQGFTLVGETNRSDTDTDVNPDGSYEFPKVTQGKYILSATPAMAGAASFIGEFRRDSQDSYVLSAVPASFAVYRSIEVTDEDIRDIEIFIPSFSLKFAGPSNIEVPVMSDGTFNISLPKGEYHVTPGELPNGYSIKSILADAMDLRRETLRLDDVPPFIMIVLDAH